MGKRTERLRKGRIVMGRPIPKYSTNTQTVTERRPDYPLERLTRYHQAQTTDRNN